MIYQMKLQPEYFFKIKKGSKTIEARLFDEKRRMLKVDDQIEFQCLPDLNKKITANIVELLKYKNFTELFGKLPIEDFGEKNKEKFLSKINTIYSQEDQAKYSVIGIRIELSH